MLTKEQIVEVKKQLLQQIQSFPEDKKQAAKKQIDSMSDADLEIFLKQNNLLKDVENSSSTPQCIFCSIVEKQTQSYQIDENKSSIAILEINPISKAHCLVIPKEHSHEVGKIPQTAFSLAKKIAKKIKTRFKPKEVIISSSCLFEHCIINIVPVYENETLESPRQQANPEELLKLQKSLEKKSKPKIKKVKPQKSEQIDKKIWYPIRFP